jgi:hypothetical protein
VTITRRASSQALVNAYTRMRCLLLAKEEIPKSNMGREKRWKSHSKYTGEAAETQALLG